ncbi:hypothetical protein J6590_032322 [Homalodisca vitripennis]|nr:hypothetical protein J6590_032322 [Homalodisca vitripennis]
MLTRFDVKASLSKQINLFSVTTTSGRPTGAARLWTGNSSRPLLSLSLSAGQGSIDQEWPFFPCIRALNMECDLQFNVSFSTETTHEKARVVQVLQVGTNCNEVYPVMSTALYRSWQCSCFNYSNTTNTRYGRS